MGLDLSRFGRLAQNARNAVAGKRSRGTARSGVVSKPQEGRPRFQLLAQWRQRIEEARRSGSFVDQAGQYAAGQTTRDYLCNTIGQTAAGSFFFLISIVATHFAGTEQAGMFSLAVTIGLLLMFVGNGVYIVVVLITAFAFGGPSAINPATTTDFFGAKYTGTNYGVAMLSLGLSSIIFNAVSNALVKATGTYYTTFVMGAVTAAITIVLQLIMNKCKKKMSKEAPEAGKE